MERLAQETIDQVWDDLTGSSQESVQQMLEELTEEQPVVFEFLMAAEDDLAGEVEQGQMLVLGTWIWKCFAVAGARIRRIEEHELDAAQDANVAMLESLSEESEIGYMHAAEKMMKDYNQMPLLGAVVAGLMAEESETPELAGDHVGLALIYLKSVIDCLDRLS